jgi:hypothetical protein
LYKLIKPFQLEQSLQLLPMALLHPYQHLRQLRLCLHLWLKHQPLLLLHL